MELQPMKHPAASPCPPPLLHECRQTQTDFVEMELQPIQPNMPCPPLPETAKCSQPQIYRLRSMSALDITFGVLAVSLAIIIITVIILAVIHNQTKKPPVYLNEFFGDGDPPHD